MRFTSIAILIAATAGVASAGQNVWTQPRDLPVMSVFDVAIADSDPAIRYTTSGYKSKDGGETWQRMNVFGALQRLAVSSTSADTVYAVTTDRALKTTDGGLTWNGIAPHASDLAIAPSNSATVYAQYASAMQKTTDGGNSWQNVADAPVDSYRYNYFPYVSAELLVDPADDKVVYVCGSEGLGRSTDGGASWTLSSAESIYQVAVDRRDSAVLYGIAYHIGLADDFLVRSTDRGDTWSRAGLVDRQFHWVATGGPRVCAQTYEGPVFCSENGGPWVGLVDGPQPTPAFHLAIDASGRHLASATPTGVWQYDIAGDDIHPDPLDDDPLRMTAAFDAERAVVIPIAGSARGASALYTTELTIANPAASPQKMIAVWLPQGNGTARTFQFDAASGTNKIFDAGARFGVDGIGSLVVFPADPDGTVDASARIWAAPYDQRAPLPQDVARAGAADLNTHTTATADNLAQDSSTRTNIGIVNLSAEPHTYVAQISGERNSRMVTITVPGFSLLQVGVPEGDYGLLSIKVTADAESRWLFYGSSIDRTTGKAHMSFGKN